MEVVGEQERLCRVTFIPSIPDEVRLKIMVQEWKRDGRGGLWWFLYVGSLNLGCRLYLAVYETFCPLTSMFSRY